MPVRVYDIAKKLGLENKEILVKAKEMGITAAKVPSSSLDKISAEWLEEEIIKTNPAVAARMTGRGNQAPARRGSNCRHPCAGTTTASTAAAPSRAHASSTTGRSETGPARRTKGRGPARAGRHGTARGATASTQTRGAAPTTCSASATQAPGGRLGRPNSIAHPPGAAFW